MPNKVIFLYRLLHKINQERLILTLLCFAILSVGLLYLKDGQSKSYSHSVSRNYSRKSKPIIQASLINTWKNNFKLAHPQNSQSSEIIESIFLGSLSSISKTTKDLFQRLGLSHLLSASGYNCWIVSVAFQVFFLLGLLALSKFKFISPIRIVRLRLNYSIFSVIGAWLFWLWSDQTPPISRAAIYISVKFVFDRLGLGYTGLRLLMVLYLGSLVLCASLWRSVSFQLSFLCLFGVLFSIPYSSKIVTRVKRRFIGHPKTALVLGFIAQVMITSLGACLGASPVTWIYFGEINFNGVLLNLFIPPIVSIVIMPLALVTMLLSFPGIHFGFIIKLTHYLAYLNTLFGEVFYSLLCFFDDILPFIGYRD